MWLGIREYLPNSMVLLLTQAINKRLQSIFHNTYQFSARNKAVVYPEKIIAWLIIDCHKSYTNKMTNIKKHYAVLLLVTHSTQHSTHTSNISDIARFDFTREQ